MRNRNLIIILCVLSIGLLAFRVKADYNEHHGRTVELNVLATDTSGGTLRYNWKSTDGHINNVNSATTAWTLPEGPGFHFAYVLVSNGLGGYTERRIAINTDTLSSDHDSAEQDSEHDGDSSHSSRYHAPPAPAQVGDYWRSRVILDSSNAAGNEIYVPGASVFMSDGTNRYPPSGFVTTDLKGEYVIPGVLPGTTESVTCLVDGVSSDCSPDNVMLSTATSHYVLGGLAISTSPLVGTFTLADGTPCGTLNEFFGVHVTATATLLDSLSHVLAGPAQVNEFGDFFLSNKSGGAFIQLSCEGATPVKIPVSGSATSTVLPGVIPPMVTDISATLHGTPLTAPVAQFQGPPTALPSDVAPRTDNFLAEKGLDSRLGACKYYEAIGAVKGCGPAGELKDPITYLDWQKAVKIGHFAHGAPTFKAAFINKVDLNLARVHESVSYGSDQTAAVVCNHIGAKDFFNPTQTQIDTAVENAVHGKDLVACVAMDYLVSPGVNNDQPFIRFLIFGPSGELLPSVNLDGRREKFVPGTCVVCHGGDHYAGKFPEDGTGFANVGGHFLPYDAGNFEFASKSGLQKCQQEDSIFHLNQNVLNAGPNIAEDELIGGWYSSNGTVSCPASVHHVLNEDYVPPSWLASTAPSAVSYYKDVSARSCRTCHVAMIEGYNFDHYQNVVSGTDALPGGTFDFAVSICGNGADSDTIRWNTMPNSLVTFNRFWLSYQNTIGIPDQVTLLQNFTNDTGNGGYCNTIP